MSEIQTATLEEAIRALETTIESAAASSVSGLTINNTDETTSSIGRPNLSIEPLRLVSFERFETSLDRVCAIPEQLVHQWGGVGQALSELDETMQNCFALPDYLDDVTEHVEANSSIIISRLNDISEKIISVLPEVLSEISTDLADLFEAEIGRAIDDLLEETNGAIVGALSEIQGQTHEATEILAHIGQSMLGKFRDKAESTIKDELQGAVNEIAETAVTSALGEIVESFSVTTISAQITAALSAEIPELIVAKNAVGAVRELLSIARARG